MSLRIGMTLAILYMGTLQLANAQSGRGAKMDTVRVRCMVNIIITVDDLKPEVARLRKDNLHFRNGIASGPGGSEILLDDPSGNPIELFQAWQSQRRLHQ